MKRRGVVILLAVALAAVACNGGTPDEPPSPSPSPTSTAETPSPSPTPGEPVEVEVWFAGPDADLFVAERTIPPTQAVGTAAMEELLAGPTDEESDAGVTSAIPTGARLLGLVVEDGIATVDLSSEYEPSTGTTGELLTVAQVVFTLTQFPTVDAVRFELEGEPVELFGSHGLALDEPQRRRDYRDLLPAILVRHPSIGEEVTSPVTISGTANVFEATVSIRILDAEGSVIVETFTTATCGTGCRGRYEEEVAFEVGEEQGGTVMVFEASAETGEPINVVRIPVTLLP